MDWEDVFRAYDVRQNALTDPVVPPPPLRFPTQVIKAAKPQWDNKKRALLLVLKTTRGYPEVAGVVYKRRDSGIKWILPTQVSGARIVDLEGLKLDSFAEVERLAEESAGAGIYSIGLIDPSQLDIARRGTITTTIAFSPLNGEPMRPRAVVDLDSLGRERFVFPCQGGYPASAPMGMHVVPIQTFTLRVRWREGSPLMLLRASVTCNNDDLRAALKYLFVLGSAALPYVTVLHSMDVPASLQMALPTGRWMEVCPAGVACEGFGLRIQKPTRASSGGRNRKVRSGNLRPQRLFSDHE